MKLTTSKILRVKVTGVKTAAGNNLPIGTRVVVMSWARESIRAGMDMVKVFVSDPDCPEYQDEICITQVNAFSETSAGNPFGRAGRPTINRNRLPVNRSKPVPLPDEQQPPVKTPKATPRDQLPLPLE